MKTRYTLLVLASLMLGISSCNVMDLSPKDKVSADVMLSSEGGIMTFMANLYYNMPWQDFNYNRLGDHFLGNCVGIYPDEQTDNAINSEFNHFIDGGGNFGGGGGGYDWWTARYNTLRDVNYLISVIPGSKVLSDAKKGSILAEAHFLRGWLFFDMAKRYGGVSIITAPQEMTPDPVDLRVPRSTEKETWDFVMEELQAAADGLPETRSDRRATKYIALALKSRAALFAASVAKFNSELGLEGKAVTEGLVGLPESEAKNYYKICRDACEEIISSGRFGLYKPSPKDPAEAQNNLLAYFQNPNIAPEESMLLFGYEKPGSGHAIDFWCNPYQTRDGGPHPGRMNPSLDLVDTYECYSDPGHPAPIVTTVNGNYNDYNGYTGKPSDYLHFDNAYDIFADKDARLWATVILPFTEWKGKTIRIQAGFIRRNGQAVIEADKATEVLTLTDKDGNPILDDNGKEQQVTYHTFGAASMDDYSGFDQSNLSCMSRSGFSFKKFLSPKEVEGNSQLGYSLQDWAEIRYAEVLLNYAEAVVESGEGDAALAKECLNATRHRAAFKDDIPLTVENVQRERRVEFAFECKRWDDLIRRREMHKVWNHFMHHSLDPVLDCTQNVPSFIFIRKNAIRWTPQTFQKKYYYNPIQGVGNNGLTQNPQW